MLRIYTFLTLPMQLLRYTSRYLTSRFISVPTRALSTTTGKSPFLMVASIGNPDPDYNGTRHSVGHWVLDQLVTSHWNNFKPFAKHRNVKRGKYSVSSDNKLSNMILFKSDETFMNLQGDPIISNWRQIRAARRTDFDPALVVIHDEISLPLGKIQIRRQGTSARGHNGLRSIDKLGDQNYTKIAVGVGQPPNKYVATYVLSKFKRSEVEILTYDVMPQIVDVLKEMYEGKYIYEKVNQ